MRIMHIMLNYVFRTMPAHDPDAECNRCESRTLLPLKPPQPPAHKASSLSGLLPNASKPQKCGHFYL